MTRYTLPELKALSKKELEDVGRGLGVRITKHVNKATAVKRICRAYSDADVSCVENPASDLDQEKTSMPENADFEALAGADGDVAEPEARGGARPGSGRPKGMTAAKARMANLPDLPNEIILLTVTAAFDLWAKKSGVREVALSQEEAVELALPLTRLGEYYGITDYLPEQVMLWVAPVWAAYNIFKVKRQMIVDVKGGVTGAGPASKDNDGVRETGQRQDDEGAGTDGPVQPSPVL